MSDWDIQPVSRPPDALMHESFLTGLKKRALQIPQVMNDGTQGYGGYYGGSFLGNYSQPSYQQPSAIGNAMRIGKLFGL